MRLPSGLRQALVRGIALPCLLGLWRSCRITISGWPHLIEGTRGPCMIAFWHDRLLLIPHFLRRIDPHRPYCALISHSRDGQLLRAAGRSFSNLHFVSVPHDRRAHVLRAAKAAMSSGQPLLVTPDGPRGPKRQVKAGLLSMAALAQASILPMSWSASRFWNLPTWDRMILPQPGARIDLRFGPPLQPPHSLGDAKLPQELARVRDALDVATQL